MVEASLGTISSVEVVVFVTVVVMVDGLAETVLVCFAVMTSVVVV